MALTDARVPEPERAFFLEAKVPTLLSGDVTAKVDSLDIGDIPLVLDNAIAPSSITVPMVLESPGPDDRFVVLRSAKPISAFDTVVREDLATPSPSADAFSLEAVKGGRLSISYTTSAGTFQDTPKQEIFIRKEKLFAFAGEPFKLEVAKADKTAPPGKGNYTWTITVDGTELPEFKKAKDSSVWILFSTSAEKDDLEAEGVIDDAANVRDPIVIVRSEKVNPKRRGTITMKVAIKGVKDGPKPITMPLALSSSKLPNDVIFLDETDAEKSSKALQARAGYGFYKDNEAKFLAIERNAAGLMKDVTGAEGLAKEKRILYSTVQAETGAFALTAVSHAPRGIAAKITEANATFEDTITGLTYKCIGTAVLPKALELSVDDLDHIILNPDLLTYPHQLLSAFPALGPSATP